MSNYRKGKIAEFFARLLLKLKGYTILKRNFKIGRYSSIGEIDIIAKKGDYVVFVEVKKRADMQKAAYALSECQKNRIIRGVEMYLKRFPQYKRYNIRFDVILVVFPFQIRHIENAWERKSFYTGIF